MLELVVGIVGGCNVITSWEVVGLILIKEVVFGSDSKDLLFYSHTPLKGHSLFVHLASGLILGTVDLIPTTAPRTCPVFIESALLSLNLI